MRLKKAPFCAAKQLTAARPSKPKAARLSKKHPSEPKAARLSKKRPSEPKATRLKNKKEQQVHLQPENLLLFFYSVKDNLKNQNFNSLARGNPAGLCGGITESNPRSCCSSLTEPRELGSYPRHQSLISSFFIPLPNIRT